MTTTSPPSLSVADAVDDAVGRLTDRRLLPLFAAVYLVQVLLSVGTQSQLAVQRARLEAEGETAPLADLVPPSLPLAVDVPLEVAALGWLVASVLLVAVTVVLLRALVTVEPGTDPDAGGDGDGSHERADPHHAGPAAGADGSEPADDGDAAGADAPSTTPPTDHIAAVASPRGRSYELDGLVAATANGVAGGVVVGTAVGVGLLAFVLPGLFLAVALAFTLPYVATARASFVEAMRRSWRLTRGDRLRVFGVVVAAVGGYVGIGVVGGFAAGLLELATAPAVGELANVGFAALAWTYATAVVASAFDRLEAIRAAERERWAGVDDDLLP